LLLFIYGLGGLLGSQIGGRLSDRFGPNRTMLVALALCAANLAALPWALSSEFAALFAMLIWGFAGWAIFSAQQSRLLHLAPQDGNVVLSLNQSSIYLGSASGALLGAALLRYGVSTDSLTRVAAGLLLFALLAIAASAISAAASHRQSPR
jgi:predicted MFS family arabinose efflux permease